MMGIEGYGHAETVKYPSKKDAWIIAVLGVACVFTFVALLSTLAIPGAFLAGGWVGLLISIGVWGFVFSFLFRLYYEITPSSLIIHTGWMQKEIPLDSIQQVYPTNNMLSAPALSLDRLQIDYRISGLARFTLISPRDRQRFLLDLAQQAPDLELSDDRLIRRQQIR